MRRKRTTNAHGSVKLILLAGGLLFLILCIRFFWPLHIETTYVLREGQSMQPFYDDLSWRERFRLKWYLRRNPEVTTAIQPGTYVFSGSYSPREVVDVFLAWPQQVYNHITILEGRSSYDIDEALADDELIDRGAYHAFITDTEIIVRYAERYPFLAQAVQERWALTSLEGYLYPDTYYVDPAGDLIEQLVLLQLEAFNQKVWIPYGERLTSLTASLSQKGYSFSLSSYGALILASIIEKEEFLDANKPDIASVFFNRLENNMRLDADISLCYGLAQPYDLCTTAVIVEYLGDDGNLYNTRARAGLPPTPISNPNDVTVAAVLDAQKSNNFFYLHDNSGQIHVSETISQHNEKKSKYLK